MQQLFGAFGVSWGLLLAQAINFAIVLVALWYFLYKPVMAAIAKRQALIAEGVKDAEKAKEVFAGADAQAAKKIKSADEEAERIVTQAREAAGAEKSRLLREAEERAALVTKNADERAVESLERAQRESERDIARLAVLAAEKVLKEHHD
jgi:F-type H+-transporting ATPase subunit b